jgi:two-component system sensor histidine kinase UhpB
MGTPLRAVHRYGNGTAARAGLVALACFLGSNFEVAYPQLGTAILFPPYAVLTVALVFSPVRRWWVFLLASALGNYLPHRENSPASWVLLCEGANFSRALLAAAGIRYLSPDGPRLDTFLGVAAFLACAVVVGPLVAAFLGAGVVALHGGAADYWLIWQAWFLSNALTGLTLLPILLIGVGTGLSWTKRLSGRQVLEASALLVGLLTVGILIFAGPYGGPSSLPVRLYAPLPFVLWAAVRFGPGGTSAAILVLTALTIWGALSGHGPFVTQSPSDNLLSLQLFLLALSAPSMFLAAAMAERRQTAAALQASHRQTQDLAGRLIVAQEAERARIARDLHDDINQQLAGLSITLSGLRRRLPEGAEARDELARLQRQVIDLADDVRALSHELHPSVLRHTGLVSTLRAHGAEFGSRHPIDVTVDADEGITDVPPELALCLYRVAQEALQNVARHAGATCVRVALARTAGGLALTITDDGQGFDQAAVRPGRGLGLISLDERVHLVGGSLRIDTRPQWGTEVRVEVPAGGREHEPRSRAACR